MAELLPKQSSEELEREFDYFVKLFSRGLTRIEICDKLAIDPGSPKFEILQDRFYNVYEDEAKSKSPFRIFSEYVAKKSILIQDLEGMKKSYESKGEKGYKNGQAYVSAVKTQSDIIDSIIKTGQELGIIIKTPEKIELVDGRDPRDMNNDELKNTLRSQMEKLTALSEKAGVKSPNATKILSFTADGSKK